MLLSYETATKLKDAGFRSKGYIGAKFYSLKNPPQGVILAQQVITIQVSDRKDFDEDTDLIYIPTLSELIEAFQGRYKYIDGLINDAQICLRKSLSTDEHIYIAWLDGDWESTEFESKYRFFGKTPEEAVANLWLALNKK